MPFQFPLFSYLSSRFFIHSLCCPQRHLLLSSESVTWMSPLRQLIDRLIRGQLGRLPHECSTLGLSIPGWIGSTLEQVTVTPEPHRMNETRVTKLMGTDQCSFSKKEFSHHCDRLIGELYGWIKVDRMTTSVVNYTLERKHMVHAALYWSLLTNVCFGPLRWQSEDSNELQLFKTS